MILSLNDVSREMLVEAHDAALDYYRSAVRPIYGASPRRDPEHIGSAFLLDLGGVKYLVTAAHVIDHNEETTLYIGGDDRLHQLEFVARVTAAPDGDRSADVADFAYARLPDDAIANLSDAKFITRSEISQATGTSAGRGYLCLGYPNSKNKFNRYKSTSVTSNLGNYSSIGKDASVLPSTATDADHVLVDFDPKFSMNDAGLRVTTMSMPGFSGGAIIDLGVATAEGFSMRNSPKLAAVLIEQRSAQKVILGTRLSTILEAISRHP